jgi:pyruvate dehydrogenase E1 component
MSLTATPADSDTGTDRVLREGRRGLDEAPGWVLDTVFPAERTAPMVTVLDGHPHTLAFLAGVRGVPATHLGVTDFGQSGDLDSVYRHHGLDVDSVVGAALDLVD